MSAFVICDHIMSLSVECISGHWFVGGVWGILSSDDYFRCKNERCPFSVLMNVQVVDSKRVAVSCNKVVMPVHFHDNTEKSRRELKHDIQQELNFIHDHPDDHQAQQLKDQHDERNRSARKESQKFKDYLINHAALKVYALNHADKSGKKLKVDCGLSMKVNAICNVVHRELEKAGKAQNIADTIRQKTHHVLGSDGNDIVVFGQTSSITLLSKTTLIQGDGTFTCVVNPFSQLYIFQGSSKTVSHIHSSTAL